MSWRVLQGDVLARLADLPDNYVQCVVTSPPYWGLRDYKTPGQLGLEPTPEEYVAKMVAVFREVRRVLRGDGTLWLNMGDCYGGYFGDKYAHKPFGKDRTPDESTPPNKASRGAMAKQLYGMPWRLAFALQADGWWLRSDIIWAKSNPMPESVTDRPTKSHEYLFLLTKSAQYYYDQEAVREPDAGADHARRVLTGPSFEPSDGLAGQHTGIRTMEGRNGAGRNLRTVWTIPTEPFPEAHFATFPRRLVLPCIQAGTSAKGCCAHCYAPWERGDSGKPVLASRTTGWRPTCRCPQLYDPLPCKVLDPFCGSGTVGVVAGQLGREFIGIELNAEYVAMAERRIRNPKPEPTAEVPEGQLGLW